MEITERPTINKEAAEACKLFGIHPSILEKVLKKRGDEMEASSMKFEPGIDIIWYKTKHKYRGFIGLKFFSNIEKQELIHTYRTDMVQGYISSTRVSQEPGQYFRKPLDSLFIFLTELATINTLANQTQSLITHLVFANESSQSFYKRLHENQLYPYANKNGEITQDKNEAVLPTDGEVYTIYCGKYPMNPIEPLLRLFIQEDAVDTLIKIRNKLMKSNGIWNKTR